MTIISTKKLKLFVIPTPWDYHGKAEFLVFADTKDEAIKFFEEYKKTIEDYWSIAQYKLDQDDLKEIKEIEIKKGSNYINSGCDC